MGDKTFLYRHFDADRNLLYVGVTSNIGVRNASHIEAFIKEKSAEWEEMNK